MGEASPAARAGAKGLSYEAEAQLARAEARKRYWRAIWGFSIGLFLVTATIAVTANALYRLSVARTLYWPASLTLPEMNFEESDPLLDAYVRREACEQTADEYMDMDTGEHDAWTCEIIASLARGELNEAAQRIRGVESGTSKELLPSVKSTLARQLVDSAGRRDWATCASMAWVALEALDKQDSTPKGGWASDNQLLLLAGSCQFPRLAYFAEDDYLELTRRVATGTHLEGDYVDQLMQRPTGPMQAWGHYFDGIAKLRAREAARAAASFQECLAANPPGILRELALLGKARALFWLHTLTALDPSETTTKAASEVRAELRGVAKAIRRASFRSDVEHYIREAR